MSDISTQVTLPAPELSWQEGLPFAIQFQDPYFSKDDGLAESQHVFLQHNGIPNRWQSWPWAQQPSFCIVETGFGTGLNFLLTWQQWRVFLAQQPHSTQWLHFTSIEKYPLTPTQLQQALALWPELQDLAALLMRHYPLPLQGAHILRWPEYRISLTLWLGDVEHVLPQLSGPVHAWYLDGFAPTRNPAMWNATLFRHMRRLSHQATTTTELLTTTVATFTAAGEVRRGLQGAGFSVQKQAGFGHKRSMLSGRYARTIGPEQPAYFHDKPWLIPSPQTLGRVAVVGAGLTGCYSARALAERGFRVTVFDHHGIAQQASGNPLGGIYLKLSAGDSAVHTDFYLSAYQFALQSFERYLGAGDSHNPYWQQCGLLQLAYDTKEALRQSKYTATHQLPSSIVHALDQDAASTVAGTALASGGLFFPNAGWVRPAALCERLLAHPNIEFIQQEVTQLQEQVEGWNVVYQQHAVKFEQVVIANAMASADLFPDAHLPLNSIRGQLSYLPSATAPTLNTVLSGRSYLTPVLNDQQCLGATFNLNDTETELREQDHLANLSHLPDFGHAWQQQAQQGLGLIQGGRVGFRCNTPDYLPMVGSVPNQQDFLTNFHSMSADKNRVPSKPYRQYQGLWLNIGHGSRGLVSTPLAAELLAAMVSNSTLPVGQDLIEALWPGRFLLRDMVRQARD